MHVPSPAYGLGKLSDTGFGKARCRIRILRPAPSRQERLLDISVGDRGGADREQYDRDLISRPMNGETCTMGARNKCHIDAPHEDVIQIQAV